MISTVYVSEASSVSLEILEKHRVRVLSHFVDVFYERSSFCIGGLDEDVRGAIVAVAQSAVARLDFRRHSGSHPALGVVDHVSVNPVLDTTLEEAGSLARNIASGLEMPVLLYGAAEDQGRSLKATRRMTPYFGTGPDVNVDPRVGLCCCGAVPHVLNYNVKLATDDVAKAKRITAQIRQTDAVEALALRHNDFIEVACNLLDVTKAPPDLVFDQVQRAAQREGVAVDHAYVIGLTLPDINTEMRKFLLLNE